MIDPTKKTARGKPILDRMRAKAGLAPAAPKPQASKPTQPPTVDPLIITHACGHHSPFQEIAGDTFRDKRIVKEQKRNCPACRSAKAVKQQEESAKRKTVKKSKRMSIATVPPDCGIGYRFEFDHPALRQWVGRLIRLADDRLIGVTERNSMNQTLVALNQFALTDAANFAAKVVDESSTLGTATPAPNDIKEGMFGD